ncbi:MAG: hypothetical protein RLY31_3140 [Bacteroidota bacterium]|jgi:hypothetical protein
MTPASTPDRLPGTEESTPGMTNVIIPFLPET